MRKLYLVLALQACLLIQVNAQCPRVAGIMVDACGVENQNEFVFLLNGNTALNVDDIGMTFPTNGSITSSNNNDFSLPQGTSVAPVGSCITVLTNGDVIPANAPAVIFMSNNVGQAYDFTSWCTQYGQLYILYRNLASPTTPTFLNDNPTPTTRSVGLTINGSPSCSATFTYNVSTPSGSSVDGNFYRFPVPTSGTSISPGFVNNGCASPPPQLLPVTLTSFTGSYINHSVILNWVTATEINADHFGIERSSDSQTFETIGSIAASGNSTVERSYSYTDRSPLPGRSYYRLRTVDIDGGWKLSKIISIQATASGIAFLGLYPNPVQDELVIEWNARQRSNAQVSVVDMLGRVMQSAILVSVAGYNQARLRTGQLEVGEYFLKMQIDSEVLTQKFLKR